MDSKQHSELVAPIREVLQAWLDQQRQVNHHVTGAGGSFIATSGAPTNGAMRALAALNDLEQLLATCTQNIIDCNERSRVLAERCEFWKSEARRRGVE